MTEDELVDVIKAGIKAAQKLKRAQDIVAGVDAERGVADLANEARNALRVHAALIARRGGL